MFKRKQKFNNQNDLELSKLMTLPLGFITENNYNKITLDWIKRYSKKHNYSIWDVMDELKNKFCNESKGLIFDCNTFNFGTFIFVSNIQRALCCSYQTAQIILTCLEKQKIISKVKYEKFYKVLDKTRFEEEILKEIEKRKKNGFWY